VNSADEEPSLNEKRKLDDGEDPEGKRVRVE
jgi:hypothetical protein